MTLVQLEYVLAVAQHKNFTLAAEKSFVTQPTLSMQIQKLEKELDVEIFNRSTHPITITNIGKEIIQQAKNILSESKKMNHLVNESKNSMSGTLTLGIIPTILPTLLPLFYKNFTQKFPHLKLIIKELKTEDLTTQLKEGTLDFGIATTPLSEDGIKESPLYYEPLVAFVPKNHKFVNKTFIDTQDLSICDILVLEEGHCFRNNILSICDKSVLEDKKLHLESGSFQALINLAKDGFGMTMLPLLHSEILPENDKKLIKQFSEPSPTREVSLLYSNSQIRLSFVKEFTQLVQGIIRGKLYLESKNITSPKLKVS